MRIEKKFLIIVLLAIVLAIPVALALKNKDRQLRIERSQNDSLQFELDTKAEELELKKQELQKIETEKTDLQKKVEDQDKQLQSKAEAKRQSQLAAVSVSTSYSGNCNSYRELVAQYNWDTNVALAIMQAESGCRPDAVSPTNDHGLMQINKGLAIYGQQIYDPAYNVKIAYEKKYLQGGWKHWTVYNTGAYKKYLS